MLSEGLDSPLSEGLDSPLCEGLDSPLSEGLDSALCEGLDSALLTSVSGAPPRPQPTLGTVSDNRESTLSAVKAIKIRPFE